MLIRLSKSDVSVLCRGYPHNWKRKGEHDIFQVTSRCSLFDRFPHVISSLREKKQVEIQGCETVPEIYFTLCGGQEVSALLALVIKGIRSANLSSWVYRSGDGENRPFNHWLVVE